MSVKGEQQVIIPILHPRLASSKLVFFYTAYYDIAYLTMIFLGTTS